MVLIRALSRFVALMGDGRARPSVLCRNASRFEGLQAGRVFGVPDKQVGE